MVEEIRCIMKGKYCRFVVKNLVIFMQTENTGDFLIRLGNPKKMKREILMSRNKLPQICVDFVNAWKPEDIEKVSKMKTDKAMIKDMRNDFKEMGFELL